MYFIFIMVCVLGAGVIPMKRMGEMQRTSEASRKLPLFLFSITDAPLSTVLAPTEILWEFYQYPDPQCKFFPKYPINSFLMLVLYLKHIFWFQRPLQFSLTFHQQIFMSLDLTASITLDLAVVHCRELQFFFTHQVGQGVQVLGSSEENLFFLLYKCLILQSLLQPGLIQILSIQQSLKLPKFVIKPSRSSRIII